ncbi:DNA end-binding protein Ku [Aureimonas altamirensis DSM 21988]|uniref:Non-homologous end joining protein Ku n=1 Tax=Aureimonas altamirensis DSM 21988 TaxID=1121026 RepID=A0ABY1IPI6_9HYPH|nr:Ku protein [Aureimonas altamirensis]SHJ78044.1 DNA end-binding protein Ku [Aureimonas altamirensis DSM 21988]
MAPRTFWKGYLKLSLVTCPVTMMPALTDQEKVRFHTLNAQTGNRVVSRYVDSETGKVVKEEDEARAWQRGEDDFVVVEDEEIDAVGLESTRTIDIERFVKRDTVGWVWFDRPHYVMPSDPVGEEAFVVIREAMAATGTAGLSRVVMYRRERPVLLEPRDKGIVLWTLRYGDEVREDKDYFTGIGKPKADAALSKMMLKLVDARTTDWDPAMVEDPVQDKLKDLIESRRKKRKSKPGSRKQKASPAPEAAGNVISIMDALRKSLDDKGKKR